MDAPEENALGLSLSFLSTHAQPTADTKLSEETTPSEGLASAILALVVRLRELASSPAADEVSAKEVQADDASFHTAKSSSVRRKWPFKRSSRRSESPPDTPKPITHLDSWDSLLQLAAFKTNQLIAAQALSGTDSIVQARNPPLFWLLYHGHNLLKSLYDSITAEEASPDALDQGLCGADPTQLVAWCESIDGVLNDYGLTRLENNEKGQQSIRLASEDDCPLLSIYPQSMLFGSPPTVGVSDATMWAFSGLPTQSETMVGRLQTIHLFRSKKAPFYHEYVLASFGHDGAPPTSWVRLERAARIKDALLIPQADTLRPLFRGVAARETMSISGSKERLCANSNELAQLVPTHSAESPIYLRALQHQMMSTSNSNPLYQLFTANCRWYSRRGFLNVLQWCELSSIPYQATWKGATATAERIRRKLEGERFGGSKISDHRGQGLDHRNLINLAMARFDWGRLPAKEDIFDPHLKSLDQASLEPNDRAVIIADVLTKRACVLGSHGKYERAIADLERAVALVRALPLEAYRRDEQLGWSLFILSPMLRMSGRAKEAIPIMNEAIELGRGDGLSVSKAYRFVEQGCNYKAAGQLKEAIALLGRSLHVFSRMEQEAQWQDMRSERVNVLIMLARALRDLEEYKDALNVQQDVVALLQDLQREGSANKLLLAMIELATVAFLAKESRRGLDAAREAISFSRKQPLDLEPLMTASSSLRGSWDYDPEAAESSLWADSAEKRLHQRGLLLGAIAKMLHGADYLNEALEASKESLRVLRLLVVSNSSKYASYLAEVLMVQGLVLLQLQRSDDAILVFEEYVIAWRSSWTAKPPITRERIVLAGESDILATLYVQAGRVEEALVVRRNIIDDRRVVLSEDKSANNQGALRDALMAYVLMFRTVTSEEQDHEHRSEVFEAASEAVTLSEGIARDDKYVEALLCAVDSAINIGDLERAHMFARAAVESCVAGATTRRDFPLTAHAKLALVLNGLKRPQDAALSQQECITALRAIVDPTMDEDLSHLARQLSNLADYRDAAGDQGRALEAAEECSDVWRTLWLRNLGDSDVGFSLCRSDVSRAALLTSLGRHTEMFGPIAEELSILRRFTLDTPSFFPEDNKDVVEHLAGRCHTLAQSYIIAGRKDDAVPAAREFLALSRKIHTDLELEEERAAMEEVLNRYIRLMLVLERTEDGGMAFIELTALKNGTVLGEADIAELSQKLHESQLDSSSSSDLSGSAEP